MHNAPLSDIISEINELPQPPPSLSIFSAVSRHPSQDIHTLVMRASICLECVDHVIADDASKPPCVSKH